MDSGSIKVDGMEIVGMKADKLSDYRRDNLGFIFQFYINMQIVIWIFTIFTS